MLTEEVHLEIRKAESSDIIEITKLFYETIQTVNSKHYPQDEIDDWASWHTDFDRWNKKIIEQYFIIAILRVRSQITFTFVLV